MSHYKLTLHAKLYMLAGFIYFNIKYSKSLGHDSSSESGNVPYYRCSKSIEFMNFINEFRCFVINSCLLAGQFPLFRIFLFGSSLCDWSKVHC
jgi:hypothetical protein